MARVSSVKRLPPKLQALIVELHEQGVSFDEITAKVRELGGEVSRSAVHRYAQTMEKVGERLRRSRDVADALVKRLGDAPESRTAQLNVELMHSVIFDLVAGGEDGAPVAFEPGDAMFLAKALESLTRAQKTAAETVFKVRQEAAKEIAAKAKEAAERAGAEAKRMGMTADQADWIRAQILGVKLPDAPAAAGAHG